MSNTHRDYVPQNPAQFQAFMIRLLQHAENQVQGDKPAWTGIPYSRLSTLMDKYSIFRLANEQALLTPTPANNNTRKEAQAECTRELRGFVNQFLRFPPVTNSDRIEMGIPNHDTIRTDHTVVTEEVEIVLAVNTFRQIQIQFRIKGTDHRAKPAGYDGAVIIWGTLDSPPAVHDELNHHTMASRTPFTLHFDETDRGKTVYAAAAWQNERGILGVWSPILSAVVP